MHLFDFAYCVSMARQLNTLANLSPEKWSFGEENDNNILRSYIQHTFTRLYDEGKVVEKDNYAIFNTGLFDIYYNPIFAHFTPNLNPDMQRWALAGFITDFQRVTMSISDIPERANYFDNPADLVFDTHLDIKPKYDHIFGDFENLERLPASIRQNPMKQAIFDGALKQTKKMLEANYKTAVPQFYNGKLQLLVPICLEEPNTPSVALTCEKDENGQNYIASTCLTMDMAYNNARLIAKPESEWLHA